MNCVLVRKSLSLASHKGAACETIVNFKFTLLWGCMTINDKEMWGFTHKSPENKTSYTPSLFCCRIDKPCTGQ